MEDKLAALGEELKQTQKKKQDLEDQMKTCKTRLDRATKLLSGLGSEKTRWQQRSAELAAQLENVVGDISTLVKDMNTSDGALNYMVKDTTLVNTLKSSLHNIEEGTQKFNENMEALKHNFLTRRYFKKMEKEAKKAKDSVSGGR